MAKFVLENFQSMMNNPQLLRLLEAMIMQAKNAQKSKQENQDCSNNVIPATESHSLEVEHGIPTSFDVALRAPSYDDISCPPKGKDRDPDKLYGKELLEKKYPPEHHATMVDNYRTVHRWFHDISLPTDLRHNKKSKDEIMQIIQKNYVQIKVLKFAGASYKWQLEDIYKWVVAAKQSKQKYSKTQKILATEKKDIGLKDEENESLLSIMGKKRCFRTLVVCQKLTNFCSRCRALKDGDALDNDLPISYTELLHSGQSKRVQAMHDPLPSEEVLKSNKEISFVPKIQRKRDEENKIEDEGDMSQATQQVLPTIDEEIPFHKGDAMSTQEVVEHENDFVAQKPSNDMNKGSENMLPTIGETQIHEGNTRNSVEKMVVVENQSDVQTSPKPSDDMIIKATQHAFKR
ncbi:hypothetical protein L7F22_064078 [Adiantum nelumboides]|nr:hypothetical protein [Adiantum nelumboides]